MKLKSTLKRRLVLPFIGLFLALSSIFTPVNSVYAEPETTPIVEEISPETTETTTENEENTSETNSEQTTAETADQTCYDQVSGIGWLICPSTGVFAQAIDAIYGIIKDLLTIDPITSNSGSPIYIVWQYARDITNIIFVIMILIIIWSQLTGVGINNYGIKKTLPRLIVAAILVNLSFIICSLAVDVSNILGVTLRGFFEGVEDTAILNGNLSSASVSWTNMVAALTGGTGLAALGIGLTGGIGHFLWVLIGAVIGALLSVFVGLVTIALRQALVAMLIMISPLAFVAYLLPNTEKYFEKWKDTLFSMLIFFPMFSVLFGAAGLAGWAIIASSKGAFGIIIGMAVQVMPLLLSISLLKMSNTALGTISNKLSSLTNHGASAAKTWTGSHAEQRKQNYLANAATPSASLRRYLDQRQRLRDLDIEHTTKIRSDIAERYAQGVIRGKHNYHATGGAKTDEQGNIIRDKNGRPIFADAEGFRTNRYTRNAARASASSMETDNAAKDTAHVLGNYSSYHNKSPLDHQIASRTMQAYMNTARTEITAVNDNEADVDWLVNQYLEVATGKKYRDKNGNLTVNPHDTPEYRHFITAAGGGLGETGSESVMAQIIEKAAKNEARHRKETAILQSKFKYTKGDARSMLVGYYVNDDGLAVDKTGKTLESTPGYLLKNDPEKLVPYDLHDENGDAYYNMTDQRGNFITRVYKKNSAAMKEILTNFDMPINDPINGLYGILAGHQEGEFANVGLPDVGLARLSTTIGRGILSSHFKEKAAFAGPMYATAVMNQYIKDYVHQNIARLDNLIKTGKAGSFNVQDRSELIQLSLLMDPKNWEKLFPEDSLRSYVNVNGEPLKGTKVDEDGSFIKDENGNYIDVPHDQATHEELFATVRKKWLIPLAPRLASMMSRYTQGTADNQKPGTDDQWEKFYASLQNYNDPALKKKYGLEDPFAEQQGFYNISRDLKERLHPRRQRFGQPRSAYSTNDPASSSTILRDNSFEVETYIEQLKDEYRYDPEEYANAILDYFDQQSQIDPTFSRAFETFSAYTDDPTLTVDELEEYAIEAFRSHFSAD